MTIAYMAGAQDTQAEIGKLRAQHHTDQNLIDAANASAQRAIAERDALRAANKDLQDWYDAAITDARRYQWLAESPWPKQTLKYALDAAIDKAMEAGNGEGASL